MTDFDYEVMQKKKLARSARAKVNGSKTKYVSLPSDHLTKKERDKMNGEVVQYPSLHTRITWKEFKALPEDLKQTYISYLRQEFGANDRAIATALRISPSTLCSYLGLHFLNGPVTGRQNEEQKAAWAVFMAEHDEVQELETNPEPVQEEAVNPAETILTAFSVTLRGDVLTGLETVKALLHGRTGTLKVSFEE